MDAEHIQRQHFASSAASYDQKHQRDEHDFALEWLLGALRFIDVNSLLDVGAGTGRIIRQLSERMPGLLVKGVEPVVEMRNIGYLNGIGRDDLVDGSAERLPFLSRSFDVVTAFALLHHVRDPDTVIAEMCRVAGRVLFVSDCNNIGHGAKGARILKMVLKSVHLWPVCIQLRTRGRGYDISDGDGASFSYSVFDSLPRIRREFDDVYLLSTKPTQSAWLTLGASHAAVLAIRRG